ncbi:hypothetical protein K7H92_15505 [Pseudomonas stutzeri]|nr:hypothetical protein [Stutzerimonas stutzeri]
MSTFSLTKGSEAALGMLASQAGSETLLLTQPARELRAELSIEPFTGDSGDQLLAVLLMREQRHSMTLQRNDGANAQHLADWVEAVANGTLDTAEAIPQRESGASLEETDPLATPDDLEAATLAFNGASLQLQGATTELQAITNSAAECPDTFEIDGIKVRKNEVGDWEYLSEGNQGELVAWNYCADIFGPFGGSGIDMLLDAYAQLLGERQAAPQTEQSGLVEALKKHRIALTPEYEGQWHAELYACFEAPLFTAEGDTPEEAVEAVVRKAQADRPTS